MRIGGYKPHRHASFARYVSTCSDVRMTEVGRLLAGVLHPLVISSSTRLSEGLRFDLCANFNILEVFDFMQTNFLAAFLKNLNARDLRVPAVRDLDSEFSVGFVNVFSSCSLPHQSLLALRSNLSLTEASNQCTMFEMFDTLSTSRFPSITFCMVFKFSGSRFSQMTKIKLLAKVREGLITQRFHTEESRDSRIEISKTQACRKFQGKIFLSLPEFLCPPPVVRNTSASAPAV